MSETKAVKFEDALQKMEDIVEKLEGGDLSLDESLKLYEEGVQISQSCSRRLEEAQKRIEILTRGKSGELSTAPAAEDLKPKKTKKK